MAVFSLKDLKRTLRPGHRLLGLDVGSKTIGVALSDANCTLASPVETIRRGKFLSDANTIHTFASQNDVVAFVIGMPFNMDGAEGPRCQSTRQFAKNLQDAIGGDIVFWDERLSTSAVERMLINEADMTRKRRAEVIDKMAAAYILQGALDALAHMKNEDETTP